MEKFTINQIPLVLGIFLLLTACSSYQNLSDDDVYTQKTSVFPVGSNSIDETSYEAYKFRINNTSNEIGYYNPKTNPNKTSNRIPPVILFGSLGNGNYSNPYYFPQNQHSSIFTQPRGEIIGSSPRNTVKYQKDIKVYSPKENQTGSKKEESLNNAKTNSSVTQRNDQKYIRSEGNLKSNNGPGKNSGNLNVPENSRTNRPNSKTSPSTGTNKAGNVSTPAGKRPF